MLATESAQELMIIVTYCTGRPTVTYVLASCDVMIPRRIQEFLGGGGGRVLKKQVHRNFQTEK